MHQVALHNHCVGCVERSETHQSFCGDVMGIAIALPIQRNASSQQPLARHMIELQPDAVGVLEQNRLIARRPLILARRADDLGAERLQEAVQLVDIGALAGAKAEVMQADTILLECHAFMLG